MATPTEEALPLIEDWAKQYGYAIKWTHEWTEGDYQCVTGFARHPKGEGVHNTIRWALPGSQLDLKQRADFALERRAEAS